MSLSVKAHATRVSTFLSFLNVVLFYRESSFSSSVKQEELAKQHTNFVLWLNQTLEERAAAIIYINDTYAKIKLEKEEIAFQKQCLQETNDLIDKHKTEYLEKKEDLTNQVSGRIYSFKIQNCHESEAVNENFSRLSWRLAGKCAL